MSEVTHMPKRVSIIPARGGSKGIPRKNLVDLNGQPLIAYAIQASLASSVDETWVSSDDDEILAVSERFGARGLLRPAELAMDTSTSESALLHFAEHVEFEEMVFIQATSPMIIADDIDRALELLNEYDSVLSVTEFTQFVWIDGAPNYDINNRKRRQDSAPAYMETGSLFATTRQALLTSKNRLSGRIGYCIVPKIRSFDVDSPDDLDVVRYLMKYVTCNQEA
jgi:N-acylneuraminate cytidylyltransferase